MKSVGQDMSCTGVVISCSRSPGPCRLAQGDRGLLCTAPVAGNTPCPADRRERRRDCVLHYSCLQLANTTGWTT